jgi:hypothetical protein
VNPIRVSHVEDFRDMERSGPSVVKIQMGHFQYYLVIALEFLLRGSRVFKDFLVSNALDLVITKGRSDRQDCMLNVSSARNITFGILISLLVIYIINNVIGKGWITVWSIV